MLYFQPKTRVYIATHGAPQDFGDCFATPSSGTDTDITPGDLAPAVHLKVSSNLPPYNFVQLDSCEAGTKDIALPFLTGFTAALAGPIGADRAFLGFTDPVEICGGNGDWTERVWDYLSQGATLSDAVRTSTSRGKPYGGVISLPLTDIDIPLGLLSHPIHPIIYGDGSMTLHGVFGGQTSWQFGNDGFEADLQWYKPL